jgi:hypothetical protein
MKPSRQGNNDERYHTLFHREPAISSPASSFAKLDK